MRNDVLHEGKYVILIPPGITYLIVYKVNMCFVVYSVLRFGTFINDEKLG